MRYEPPKSVFQWSVGTSYADCAEKRILAAHSALTKDFWTGTVIKVTPLVVRFHFCVRPAGSLKLYSDNFRDKRRKNNIQSGYLNFVPFLCRRF